MKELKVKELWSDPIQGARAAPAQVFFLRASPLFPSAPGVPAGALLASRAHEVETGQWAHHCLSAWLRSRSREFGAPPAETEGSEGTRVQRGRQPLARPAAHSKALSRARNEGIGYTTPKRSNEQPAAAYPKSPSKNNQKEECYV